MKATAVVKIVFRVVKIVVFAIGGLYLISTLLFMFGGGEDRAFMTVWNQGIGEAEQVLVSAGYCPSIERCHSKEVITVAGIPSGFSITIYGVTDRALLTKVAEVFVQQFAEHPTMLHLRVEAFPFSSKDYSTLHFWQYFSPWRERLTSLDINMKREP
ncbi:hypothetical protein [Bradyrhizobium sp.]